MPFGLANAPSSFQKMVNATLAGLRGVNLQIFIDDICIASQTWPEHLEMLCKVFKVVRESKLKLKISKCVFGAQQVLFLGHIISKDGVRQDPGKTKAILQLPRPTDAGAVRRALGMLGYYRKFIANFATIAEPLTRLLKKNQPFEWKEREERAFRELLAELAREVTLAHFNHTDPILVKTDASKVGVAALLFQKQHEDWRLVSCCSRRLNQHEENYGISELEALAIVYAVSKFRSFLLGKHFQVLTDHSALSVLNNKTPTSARLRRWALILQEFDYNIVYTRGQLQADVDCFSRAPIDPPDEMVERRIFHVAMPIQLNEWIDAYADEQSQRFLEAARTGNGGFELKNGIIYFERKLYVPPCRVTKIINETHTGPAACHGGVLATTDRLSPYWWPTKTEDIKASVASCASCQARKVERVKPAGEMKSFEIYDANELVAIDVVGSTTQTPRKNRHIMVAIDCFTRYVHAKALPDVSSTSFSEFLIEYVGLFGIPKRVLTDNAKSFNSAQTKELEKTLGVTHIFSTPTHSQGNAIVERVQQSLQDKLNLVLKQHGLTEECWDVVLPLAVLSLNTSYHKTLGYSPFEMKYGYAHPIRGQSTASVGRSLADMHMTTLQSKISDNRACAISNQSDAQTSSKTRYDQNHRQIGFAVGELVDVKARSRRSKLADKFDQVAKIVSRRGDVYKLINTNTNRTFDRHISKLKRHHTNTVNHITPLQKQHSTPTSHNTTTTMTVSDNVPLRRAILASVVAIAIAQALATVNFETPRTSFVTWREQKANVLEPKRQFEVKIIFTDPCPVIQEQFPSFWSPSAEEYNPVYYAYHGCTDLYHRSIIQPLDELVSRVSSRRKTRAIPFLGLIGGVWLSNVLDSYFNENGAIATHEGEQDKYLRELNRRQNYSTEAIVELAQNQKLFMDKVNQLYVLTNNYARDLVRLQFALSLVSTHTATKKQAIATLRFDLVNHRKLNLNALNALLDTKTFENVDSDSLEFISVEKLSKTGFVFKFFGHVIDENMKVYRINAINHWIKVTETPATLVQYAGPPFVLVNLTNNCVTGIHDLEPTTLSFGCAANNGRSNDLDLWTPVRSGNPFSDPTRTIYVEALPMIHVYCFGRKIFIEDDPELDCPPYTVALPAHARWRTNDKTFAGYPITSYSFTIAEKLPGNLNPSRIQDPNSTMFIETEALRRIYNLTALLEEEKTNALVLNTPIGGMSYSVWNKIVISSIGCCICIIVWFWVHNHRTINRHHDKLTRAMKAHLDRASGTMYPDPRAIENEAHQQESKILSYISDKIKGESSTNAANAV